MTAAQRREIWGRRLAAWRASGLSLAAFCAQQSVSRESMRRWRRRLAKEPGACPPPRSPAIAAHALVPLQIAEPVMAFAPGRPAAIEIRLRGERAIVVAGELDEARLARLIGLVERAP